MSKDFSMCRVKMADLNRILEIELACFRKDAYDRNLFAAYTRKCVDLFLAIRRDRRICGYILACRRARDAELVSVAVAPEVRGQGAASLLLESVVRRLKRSGVKRMFLMVRTTNRRALRFYRK